MIPRSTEIPLVSTAFENLSENFQARDLPSRENGDSVPGLANFQPVVLSSQVLSRYGYISTSRNLKLPRGVRETRPSRSIIFIYTRANYSCDSNKQ